MSHEKGNEPDKERRRLKNPSSVGSQQNPVSNPAEGSNVVEKELAEREKNKRSRGRDAG